MPAKITKEFLGDPDAHELSIRTGILNIGRTSIPLRSINNVSISLLREGVDLYFDEDNYKKYSDLRRVCRLFIIIPLSALLLFMLPSLFVINSIHKNEDVNGLVYYEELEGVQGEKLNLMQFATTNAKVIYEQTSEELDKDKPSRINITGIRNLLLFVLLLIVVALVIIKISRRKELQNKSTHLASSETKQKELDDINRKNSEFGLEIVTAAGTQQVLSYHDFKALSHIKDQIMAALVDIENKDQNSVVINLDQSKNELTINQTNLYGDVTIRNDYEGLSEEQINVLFEKFKPELEESLKRYHDENNQEILEQLKLIAKEFEKTNPNKPILSKAQIVLKSLITDSIGESLISTLGDVVSFF